MYIGRQIEQDILQSINSVPVTAITGPRQCGKSTLVKHLMEVFKDSIYLDLERPSDLRKLDEAEWFFTSQKDKLICIDEIQRKPEIFPLIRSLVDEWNRPGCFLILGSASRDLLKQSSESLAGRIAYKRLTPFLWTEIQDHQSLEVYISSGGFPRSLLTDEQLSFNWRENFIQTFLERDLLLWAGFTPKTMGRLWQMIAHNNGQTINFSNFSKSLGVSSTTVSTYIDLLASTYMVEIIQPYHSNTGKRLVKAPKVYISDSGISATLLDLIDFSSISGHPGFGSFWESVVLNNIKGIYPQSEIYFYRTSNGAEIDFVIKIRNKVIAIECKSSLSPTLSKGNYLSIADIMPVKTFVIAPISKSWEHKANIEIIGLQQIKTKFDEII